ncbi:MAG: sigma-70 family RNA polymerase sigma factor [Planctomycetales bacterium]|nr:sigma-70 family RNA polymerase sigma factor [Planctomycetales bacterium]
MLPDTRHSLILRLRHADDVEAWREFVEIYRPIMVRMGRRRGMQDADIEETIQQVFISVASAVVRWRPEAEGRFRSWLMRIVRNKLIDQFRASSRRVATAELVEVADERGWDDELATEIEREYRRALFRRFAAQVRKQVAPATWDAFWQTSIEGRAVEAVAEGLGLSAGSVYAARSRVVARIRALVQACEVDDEL